MIGPVGSAAARRAMSPWPISPDAPVMSTDGLRDMAASAKTGKLGLTGWKGNLVSRPILARKPRSLQERRDSCHCSSIAVVGVDRRVHRLGPVRGRGVPWVSHSTFQTGSPSATTGGVDVAVTQKAAANFTCTRIDNAGYSTGHWDDNRHVHRQRSGANRSAESSRHWR